MPGKRLWLVLCVSMVVILASCAGMPEPTKPVTIAPTETTKTQAEDLRAAPSPSSSALPPTDTAAATVAPPATPARIEEDEPTPLPLPPSESSWPLLLRELDLSLPAGNSYNPRSLALHPGLERLYVRTHSLSPQPGGGGLILVLDWDDGQVLEIVETGPDAYSEGAVVLDRVRERLYAINPGDSTASILDAKSLDEVGVLTDVRALVLDAEAGRIYVAGSDGLRVLDSTTFDPLRELTMPGDGEPLALELDPAADTLYLAEETMGDYSLSLFEGTSLQPTANVALPGRLDAMLADPARNHLYVTTHDGEQSLLWILDHDGNLLAERLLGEWTQRTLLALDAEGGRLFLGKDAYGEHGITVIDLETGDETAHVPLERAPNALAWHGDGERLWVSHTYADRISVVDLPRRELENGRVSAEFPTARELVDLEVDAGRGHVYVTDSLGQLLVLDSDTDSQLAMLPGEGLISVDGPHGRFYTGGEGADKVRIFDGDRLQQTGVIQTESAPVADAHNGELYLVQEGIYRANLESNTVAVAIPDTLPQDPGSGPNPSAIGAVVDPGNGRVFAIMSNGIPGSNAGTHLYVYEPETFERTLDDTERSPWYLDVDPSTGRAYVSRTHITGRSTSLLQGGRDYVARLDGVYGALRVDPDLERVYLTVRGDDQGQMLILDAENLDVLGATPIPGGFTLRALDTDRHLLYLGTEDGQVQIWSATGGALSLPADSEPVDSTAAGPFRLYLPPGDDPLYARDGQNRFYLSKDEGDSWERIAGGLPQEWVLDAVFSPDFATDETLFAALATADQGYGVWRSTDAGRSWRVTSRGLTDLAVADLAISPAFGNDRTLFALARDGGLYRSTDGGEHWQSLTSKYRPQDSAAEEPGQFVVSPTYADDRTLGIEHHGLRLSTDGGETWQAIDFEPPGYGSTHMIISPQHAADQAIYILWLPSDEGAQALVYGSVDGGATWSQVGAGPPVAGWGRGRVTVSPDGTLYVIWQSLSADEPARMFRSLDLLSAEGTWERLKEPPFDLFAVELTDDGSGFLALDDAARLVRWPLESLDWEGAVLPAP
ncbi:hypothetical protein ACFLWA_09745 [Chloroflexota bacterium]